MPVLLIPVKNLVRVMSPSHKYISHRRKTLIPFPWVTLKGVTPPSVSLTRRPVMVPRVMRRRSPLKLQVNWRRKPREKNRFRVPVVKPVLLLLNLIRDGPSSEQITLNMAVDRRLVRSGQWRLVMVAFRSFWRLTSRGQLRKLLTIVLQIEPRFSISGRLRLL